MTAKQNIKGLIGPLIFAGLSVGFAYSVFQIFPDDPKTCGSPTMAYVMSQAPVADLLKSPSTAKFPSYSSSGVNVKQSGECRYTVDAFVDAENSFGAVVRTAYSVELMAEKDGQGWLTMGVKID